MTDVRFDGVLLVCDMDCTLLDSRQRISRENRLALEEFVEKGGTFTVATGRMEDAVKPYISELPLNAPVILYNGAAIYDFTTGKTLYSRVLDSEVQSMLEELDNLCPGLGIEIFAGGSIYIVKRNDVTDYHIKRESLNPIYCGAERVPLPWIKAILAWDNDRLKEINSRLEGRQDKFRLVFSEPFFLEVLNSEVSKGWALTRLAELLGYSCSKVIAIGDNLNDMEMIKVAGVGIAVDNAHPCLKSSADLCCCGHDDHAAAHVINWLKDGTIKL